MRAKRVIDTIETHTAGEPTRIVTSGIKRDVTAASVREHRDQFKQNQDWVRKLLLKEPRGHDDMFGAVLVEPSNSDSDLGVFFMDQQGYCDMCGHATMGIVTALIETGQLDRKEVVHIDTPAGTVAAFPEFNDGRVEEVAVRNISSFVYDDVTVDIDPVGSLEATIVYAGNFFALVPATSLGYQVEPRHSATFREIGLRIRTAINERHKIVNPITDEEDWVSMVEFYEGSNPVDRNIVILGDGQVDRSPCGTGTCAKVTLLYEQGQLDLDEPYPYESVIGTRFEGRVIDTDESGNVTKYTPEVAGSAYITSKNTFFVDPSDPITGFSVTGSPADSGGADSRPQRVECQRSTDGG